MRGCWIILLAALLASLLPPTQGQLKKRKEVSIGYNLNFNPWKLSINKGLFERVTGYTIKWAEIKDTYKAIVALANNEVQMVVANSLDIGRAMSRGLECRLIWIVEDIHNSEAMLVHNHYHQIAGHAYGGNIASPLDLRGKLIAVWYGSTMHYSLHSLYTELQVDIIETTEYQRLACRIDATEGELEPCYYTNRPNAVTFLSMMPHDISYYWGCPEGLGSSHRRLMAAASRCDHYPDIEHCYPEMFQAAYVGYPYTLEFKKTGTVMITSAGLAKWDKVTFTGLLASTGFLYELEPQYATYNVANFIQTFIDEMAKANFYYQNNTKEFAQTYAGLDSVAHKISSVIGGDKSLVAPLLKMFKLPTMSEQVHVSWMGGGNMSRVAKALKDQSQFLKNTVKEDFNSVPMVFGRETIDIGQYQLAETIQDYSVYIDTSFIQSNIDAGKNGEYFLDPGDTVYFGYQTTANYGRTLKMITT